ncbi:MAG: FHA domain-containing protein [Burkholderiales bacterium]
MMFVEVLDRGGEVRSRQRIGANTVRIGRAYDNDLILDDPFVAAHHVIVERDAEGNLFATDLGSRNGLYLLGPARRVDKAPIGQDTRLRIGHTQLRFRDSSYPVPAELETRPDVSRRHGLRFYVALAGASAILTADSIATVFEPTAWALVFSGVLALLLGIFVWAGIWSFFGNMATHHAQFYRHGTIALLAVSGLLVMNELAGYIEFAFSTPAAGSLGLLAGTAIVGALLYGHTRLVSRVSARRAALSTFGVAAVFTASFALVEYSSSFGYSPELDYVRMLKAPAFQVVDSKTTEAFFADAESLRTEVDSLRGPPPPAAPLDNPPTPQAIGDATGH